MSDTTQEPTQEVQSHKPAVAPMQLGDRGIELRNTDDMKAMAAVMIASKLVPSSFKTPSEVIIGMQLVKELGLPMMAGLNKCAVINGRVGMWGEGLRALVFKSGKVKSFTERVEGEGDTRACIMKCERNDIVGEIEIRYSVAHAKEAGLWKKAGPWTQYPEDMLSHKAFARLSKRLFSDCLFGMESIEELTDYTPERRIVSAASEDPLLAELSAPQESK
jgi:hypothetical protein